MEHSLRHYSFQNTRLAESAASAQAELENATKAARKRFRTHLFKKISKAKTRSKDQKTQRVRK